MDHARRKGGFPVNDLGSEADRAAGGEGQDTVELLRDMMQDALHRLARSRRRRDPVVALKIACKEACHWFSAGNRKGRACPGPSRYRK
jgi:hypothetical protein